MRSVQLSGRGISTESHLITECWFSDIVILFWFTALFLLPTWSFERLQQFFSIKENKRENIIYKIKWD